MTRLILIRLETSSPMGATNMTHRRWPLVLVCDSTRAAAFVFFFPMKMLATLCLGVAFCAAFSRAATFVPPGPLLGTQVWSAANSPYVIDGDVTIGMSEGLLIEARVEVLFSSTDSAAAGVDTNRCELRVLSGQLTVSGTKTNPVIFRAISNSLPSTWYGITVTNGPGASISNAWIQDAFAGITVDNTNFTALNDITLCSNRTGIYIGRINTNTPASLRNLRVFQNINGIVLGSAMNTLLRNSVVYSNFTHGVVARRANLINCTIQGNGFGVRCISDFDDDLQLNNCLFTSNGVAISQFTEPEGGIGHSARIRAVHCAYWGNNVKLFENPPAGSTTGTNAVFGDPRYLNLAGADGLMGTADDDFRLAAGSACIDQGDKNFVAMALSGISTTKAVWLTTRPRPTLSLPPITRLPWTSVRANISRHCALFSCAVSARTWTSRPPLFPTLHTIGSNTRTTSRDGPTWQVASRPTDSCTPSATSTPPAPTVSIAFKVSREGGFRGKRAETPHVVSYRQGI